jgi:hypothetical protein
LDQPTAPHCLARDLEEHFGIDRERVRVVPNPIDVEKIGGLWWAAVLGDRG